MNKKIVLQSFNCDKDLSKYVDSMLFSRGTQIADGEYTIGDIKCRMFLEVCGDVNVDYKGNTYRDPCEFPEELRERIRKCPGWWDVSAPSGENNDDEESDIYIDMNNWFEVVVYYGPYSEGFVYESDLSKDSPDDVRKYFDEIAGWCLGGLVRLQEGT